MAKNFDLIVVLGGGLKKDENGWRTTRYDERGDNFGVQGDRLRVDAVYELYKDFLKKKRNFLLLASGGRGQFRNIPDSPPVASVIRKELLALGISKEKILSEENSNNTYQQLKELSGIISEKNFQSVTVISNRWHLPRIQTMIEYGPGLNYLKERLMAGNLSLISAEQVLLDSDPDQWKESIDIAFKGAAMQERIKKEERGVAQIKFGSYKWQ